MPEVSEYKLRWMTETDLNLVRQWRNSPRIMRCGITDHEITETEHREWFARVEHDPACRYFLLEYRGRPIGVVYFFDIDRVHDRCHWGFYLGEVDAPVGSGTALGYLALNYIFDVEKIRKVAGEVLASNQESRRFFDKIGFSQEGSLRRHVCKNGEYVDLLIYGLFAEEWQQKKRAKVGHLLAGRRISKQKSRHEISIGGKIIGPNQPPFIVAEMSGNHNQSLERALQIVEAAAAVGVDALKIQTYTADTMTLDVSAAGFAIDDKESLWDGATLYGLYQKAHTPWEWHEAIFERCRQLGLIYFSSPFDSTAIDFLESLNAPAYKIASFENVDLPLIRRAAATGKPMIISTGLATEEELTEAVSAAREAGCNDIILLKCTSAYPAPPEESHLRTIPDLREQFEVLAGLSDHTLGIELPLAAVALGAVLIEKHFTLSRADGGVDAAFSLEPEEMKILVAEARRVWSALGEVRYGPGQTEQRSLQFRRSLYIVRDMKAGETVTSDNLRAIRPGFGLAPKHLEVVLGRRVRRDIQRGTPLEWELLE